MATIAGSPICSVRRSALPHQFLEAIGIDPTVDFACKRVLGSPGHSAITLHFLDAVLQFPSPIREVQILNPPIEKDFEDDKWSLLDILAKDEQGRLYDVEVQTTRPLGLRQRLAYYAASLLVGQLESGDDYHEVLDAAESLAGPAPSRRSRRSRRCRGRR